MNLPQMPAPFALRASRTAALGSAFVLLFAFAATQLHGLDYWWHLAAGERIYARVAVPTTDPFSFTAAGDPWIDSHWLFQVAIWPVYAAAGLEGLTLFKLLLLFTAFGVAVRTNYAARTASLSAGVMGLAVLASNDRFVIRPDLLTFVMLALYFAIVEKSRERPQSRLRFALVPLHLLWSNFHGLHVLGLALVGWHAVGEELQARIGGEHRGARPLPVTTTWIAILAAMLLVSFVNPQGVTGALYPLTLFSELRESGDFIGKNVAELLSPFSAEPPYRYSLLAYFALAGLTFGSFAANGRKIRIAHVLIALTFFYLSTQAVRNVSLFALIALPITVYNARAALDRVREPTPRIETVVAIAVACALLVMSIWVASNRYYERDLDARRFGTGPAPLAYPVGALDFLETTTLGKRGFHDASSAGYAIARGRQVFIDGRWEVYGREHFALYERIMRGLADFDEVADEFEIDYVSLAHRYPDTKELTRQLAANPNWRMVYLDEAGVVFVRERDLAEHSLRGLDLRTDRVEPTRAFRETHRGPLSALSDGAQALSELLGAGRNAPAEVALGDFFASLGAFRLAVPFYQLAVKEAPEDVLAWDHLSYAEQRLGRYVEAMNAARRVEQISGLDADLANRQAIIYFEGGNAKLAERMAEIAVARDPDHAEAHSTLGAILASRGETERARALWQRALELEPGHESATVNLKLLDGEQAP